MSTESCVAATPFFGKARNSSRLHFVEFNPIHRDMGISDWSNIITGSFGEFRGLNKLFTGNRRRSPVEAGQTEDRGIEGGPHRRQPGHGPWTKLDSDGEREQKLDFGLRGAQASAADVQPLQAR